jgi:hypothetical protein
MPFELSLYSLSDLVSLFLGDEPTLLAGLASFSCRRFKAGAENPDTLERTSGIEGDPDLYLHEYALDDEIDLGNARRRCGP